MDKIFRVNMSTLSSSIEDVPGEWAGLGDRGLTSTIVATEVIPTCHPLGKNQIIWKFFRFLIPNRIAISKIQPFYTEF